MSELDDRPRKRSRLWNGCFFVLAVAWGLLLIVGFATSSEGRAWSRFGGNGVDMGPALVFFAGLGLLYGIKRAVEAVWDGLGGELDGDARPDKSTDV
jgi:hypothetical protein